LDRLIRYLEDMRSAIHEGVMKAEYLRRRKGRIPSPIDLRKEIKPWFDSKYDYAKHHINPVCRSSIAILRSFRKNRRGKQYPDVTKLSMRLDRCLVRIMDGIRITIRPGEYAFIPVNTRNKKWQEYSRCKVSEVLITDRIVSVSFSIPGEKSLGSGIIGADLNFGTVDLTAMNLASGQVTHVETVTVKTIAMIQNDFSRMRQKLLKHVINQKKRYMKLRENRGRQRNRIKDAMHRASAKLVGDNHDMSFIFENLNGIRKSGSKEGKKFRTYLNIWPYSEFQKMVEYKSERKTIYVNPGGTSSECPVCGGRLKHSAWKISRCDNCDQDYDRHRLASLAITLRGIDLCGDPFPVSASAPWQSMKNEYLYLRYVPDMPGAGSTETAYASNEAGAKQCTTF
jgi:putative transposase